MEKDFLDRGAFTDKDSALDLYSNSIRKAFEFDVYSGKTTFTAVVLTKPIFLADADLTQTPSTFSPAARDEARLSKFAFKARILGSEVPTPHQFLPDPCNPTFANEDNIKYIYLTPQLKQELERNQQFIYLLENERFKLEYHANDVEVWQFRKR